MLRRNFLQTSALATLGTLLSCSDKMKTEMVGTPYLKTLGIQLWTVRDQMEADPKATLTAIKNHGYHQVELMRLSQLDEIAPICKDLGLEIKCSHIDWTVLTGRWDLRGMEDPGTKVEDLIEKAVKNNISHMVFAYWMKDERSKLDDYKKIADTFNRTGELCNTAGIDFGYHNHSFEFENLEGSNGYAVLRERVDKDKMKFELDVFWASLGGTEPVALMHEMKDQINLLHLKDRAKDAPVELDESKVDPSAFKELGTGMVDLKGVLAAATKYGIDYCHVEQDHSPDPVKSVGQSRKYLQGLG